MSERLTPRLTGSVVKRHGHGRRWFVDVLVHGIPLAVAFATLIPFVYVLIISFQHVSFLNGDPAYWLSQPLTLDTYRYVLADTDMVRWILNSLIVAGLVTAIGVTLCAGAGYAFYLNRGRRSIGLLFGLILLGIMIPRAVTIIPIFEIISELGLTNSYVGLTLPPLALPIGVFLVRQAMFSFPMELIDAARIDGCSELAAFRKVVVPLLAPALVVVGIYTFMDQWREFLWPLIATSQSSMSTVPVGVASLSSEFRTDWGIYMAGVAIAILPGVIVFLLFQRWFLKGLTAGALKG